MQQSHRWLCKVLSDYNVAYNTFCSIEMSILQGGAIHGIRNPSNVLLDAHVHPHIGELGGCVCRDLDVTWTSRVGIPLYMAPEMYLGTGITCAVDLYACALIC
jgi:serine/threonine protein kinase